MATFNFKALNQVSGRQEAGVIESYNEAQAAEALASRGYQVVSLKEVSARSRIDVLDYFSRITVKDLVAFSRQFSVMVGASVPIVEALKIMSRQIPKPKFRKIVAEVADEVDGGGTLSSSLAKRSKLFSNFFISVVKSGEQSGKLDESINYVADEMEKEYEMNSKIRGAMIYPIFVILMMVGIGILMMMFIIPKMTAIVVETGAELPLATKVLITISNFLIAYWWLVLIFLIIFLLAFRSYLKTPFGRGQFDYLILKLPIFGTLLQMIYLVRFTRSMNTLVLGGVNISTSLEVAGEVVGNRYYQKIIKQTIEEVQSGN
jgi:type IV pilus assembly protein PilC